MKILVLFRTLDDADPEHINPLLLEEERFAWRAYVDDVLREHYESDAPYAAISIVELESVEVAREFFQELPLLKAGLITAEFFPLRPFRNWETLFREAEKRVAGGSN